VSAICEQRRLAAKATWPAEPFPPRGFVVALDYANWRVLCALRHIQITSSARGKSAEFAAQQQMLAEPTETPF